MQKNRELTAKEKMLENLNDEIVIQKNYLSNIVKSISNILITTDEDGSIKTVNDAAIQMLGYTLDELINQSITMIMAIENTDQYLKRLRLDTGVWNVEYQLIRKDGSRIDVIYSATLIKDETNKVSGFVFVAQDISARKEIEASLHELSYYDPLTKLPNRLHFEMRAKQLLARDPLPREQIAFLYFDLDGFKSVNDRLGHAVGDELLKEVSKRLQTAFRDEDFVARLSGDEFIACLTRIKDKAYVGVIAQRLIAGINRPFFIDNNEISVGLCVGIAIFPESASDYAQLLKDADIALYKAKQSGRNQFQYYTHQIHQDYGYQLELENDLRFALARREFKLAYQPIYHLKDKTIISVEALLRWENSRLGSVSPADFVPLAESIGLIVPIGEWVIEAAIKQYAQWQHQGVANFKLSINISAWQLDRGEYLVELLKTLCVKNNILPEVIQLELTETAIMHNPQQGEKTLRELHHLGFIMVIDDFGQGFSSLSLLSRLPISVLKIDKQFISDINDKKNEFIIKSIVSLSQSLRLEVIVEGIETPSQLNYLLDLGCDFGQGFLLARPMFPDKLFPSAHS